MRSPTELYENGCWPYQAYDFLAVRALASKLRQSSLEKDGDFLRSGSLKKGDVALISWNAETVVFKKYGFVR